MKIVIMPESGTLMFAAIVLIVAFVAVIFVRLVYSIPTILRNQRSQTLLLAEIAKKHGVDIEIVESIVNERIGW